jgi:hypothetical protein
MPRSPARGAYIIVNESGARGRPLRGRSRRVLPPLFRFGWPKRSKVPIAGDEDRTWILLMQILEDIRFGERSSPGRAKQLMSAVGTERRPFGFSFRTAIGGAADLS